MIVDLIRNDLSRVAIPGTVAVRALFTTEAYPTVWQLTSTVTAQVPVRTTLTDLFSALFPCGSITGAPKSRTTALITALESSPRGPVLRSHRVGRLQPASNAGTVLGGDQDCRA